MSTRSPDLRALPPGPRTDLEILLLQGSIVQERDGYLVVRSPGQPTFHWGNCLHVTTGDVDDAERWVDAFRREVPDADWLAIGLSRLPRPDGWHALGLAPEEEDALSLRGMPEQRQPPAGYRVRELSGQADWDQLFDLDLRERRLDGEDVSEKYVRFSREREAARQKLVAQRRLAWLGAFTDGGALAAALGIVVLGQDRSLARYQSVLTDHHHRRRGLAGHLLGRAARWASDQGADEFVILTEMTNPAGRLYRSIGFSAAPTSAAVYRPPAR